MPTYSNIRKRDVEFRQPAVHSILESKKISIVVKYSSAGKSPIIQKIGESTLFVGSEYFFHVIKLLETENTFIFNVQVFNFKLKLRYSRI